jgi:hypothetical protein
MRYLPKRFTHQTDLVELLIAWEIWLAIDRMDQLETTVPIMSRAIQTARCSRMSAWLSAVYAQYWLMRAELMEEDEWDQFMQDYQKGKNQPGESSAN